MYDYPINMIKSLFRADGSPSAYAIRKGRVSMTRAQSKAHKAKLAAAKAARAAAKAAREAEKVAAKEWADDHYRQYLEAQK